MVDSGIVIDESTRRPMKNENVDNNLLQALVKRSHLSWYWFAFLLTLVLVLFLVMAAFLDGQIDSLGGWDFWRQFIGAPVIVAYIFVIYPYMWRLGRNAMDTFRQLQPTDNTENTHTIVCTPRRRWEWASIVAGVLFWVLLQQAWGWDWGVDGWWLYLYALVCFSILFGLLGWLIYVSIVESRNLNRLSRQKLDLDIFNTSALIPVARASLSTSFAFLGGISLSLIFQTVDSLLVWSNIAIYAVLVAATLLIFFFSIWSTHRTMAMTKQDELSLARTELEKAIRRLKESSLVEQSQELSDLHSAVAAWGTYERHVREAREWPFNATILRRLAASTLIPALVYLLKVFLGIRLFG
jgi:hypothetical protein